MKYRRYGTTGKQVSEIGFGAWQLGNKQDWAGMEEDEAIRLVHEALDLGVNFFDTAPNYGQGKSEVLLGKALERKRDKAVINTKFGHSPEGTDYSASQIRNSVERSLMRLQTDYLDSVLIHNPPFDVLDGKYGHYQVLEDLKAEGKILAYGVSVDSSREMLEALGHSQLGVMEVMFNIFYQETAQAFQAAQEKDVALIIKVPLDSGWLSGKYNGNSSFSGVRSRWSPEVIQTRAKLVEQIRFLEDEHTTMTMAALRFILAYPEVTTVIPGVRNSAQLRENVAASSAPLPEESLRKLQELWERDIRFKSLGW
ncbi:MULTISPECIES: aldo/keto reductase [Paenibacillus]|jgi:aryl-alcohol dehydrogenase-like predicted oxidoreductase|uniref:Predicted oxidoreductase n=1 Tax=Paenibacillus barengoltzii J12 TaxID=935846 RepID=A0ABY1LYI3_9BACL|nr:MULTISPECIES: aldo/keto reductase [Paenibacillus]SME98256.1 Predicted oxidoreductase [Paenibacillus barengoltzii]SMF34495.1 Predicted oxidoreductase [Paenibacillus barengoltzii J12]